MRYLPMAPQSLSFAKHNIFSNVVVKCVFRTDFKIPSQIFSGKNYSRMNAIDNQK